MKILFMCVANSARSQMAEALARKMFGTKAEFCSAGSMPTDVNPLTVQVMWEIGIDITHYFAKSVEEFPDTSFDYVISLCAEESYPNCLRQARKLHWPFPDPAEESNPRLAEESFRRVRDLIRARLEMDLSRIISDHG